MSLSSQLLLSDSFFTLKCVYAFVVFYVEFSPFPTELFQCDRLHRAKASAAWRGLSESYGKDFCLRETGVRETNEENPQTHSMLIDLLLFLIRVCKWHWFPLLCTETIINNNP